MQPPSYKRAPDLGGKATISERLPGCLLETVSSPRLQLLVRQVCRKAPLYRPHCPGSGYVNLLSSAQKKGAAGKMCLRI